MQSENTGEKDLEIYTNEATNPKTENSITNTKSNENIKPDSPKQQICGASPICDNTSSQLDPLKPHTATHVDEQIEQIGLKEENKVKNPKYLEVFDIHVCQFQ